MPQIKHPPVIDISHWIPVQDFQALDPRPWLILTKATEGTGFLDSQYAEYADQIRDAGIRLGAYHFMLPGDPVKQADWFSDVVLDVGLAGNEILACDMEVDGISLAQIRHFLDWVQLRTGIRPILYSSQLRIEGLYPDGVCPTWLRGEWLWIAEYPTNPDPVNEIPAWIIPRGLTVNNIALWQYTDDGIVAGVGGNNVDLNLINPFFAQSIGLTQPGDPMTDYQYSITPLSSVGSAVRPDHDTANTKLTNGLPYGKLAYGNVKWVATEDKFVNGVQVNKVGDVWLQVVEVNGLVLTQPAWVAEIHLGNRYATITQIGTTDPEPPASKIPEMPVSIILGDDITYEKQIIATTMKPVQPK